MLWLGAPFCRMESRMVDALRAGALIDAVGFACASWPPQASQASQGAEGERPDSDHER